MEQIITFFSHPSFIIFGGISVFLTLLFIVFNFLLWILGIAPLLLRLGYGRWYRKIAIVANKESYSNLENDLIDSGIFRKQNIYKIASQSLTKVKDSDLLLVDYKSFNEDEIKNILHYKKASAGMVFYFPNYSESEQQSIPTKMRILISNTPNTTLTNFRGRLLNDIVTTLITTSYEKK